MIGRGRPRNWRWTVSFSLLWGLIGTRLGFGADVFWLSAVDGNFSSGVNWSGGVAPGASDSAIFGLSSDVAPFVVTLTSPATTAELRVDSQSPTFDLQGFSYSDLELVRIGFANVGNDPELTLQNGSLDTLELYVGEDGGAGSLVIDSAQVSAGILGIGIGGSASSGSVRVTGAEGSLAQTSQFHFDLADGTGSTGSLLITAGATCTLDLGAFSLRVGRGGTGTITVDGAGTMEVDGNVELGDGTGSVGIAQINGGGSTLSVSQGLYVGSSGTGAVGTLEVSAEAELDCSFALLGSGASTSGTVVVTGSGTTFSATLFMAVGGSGSGSLTVADEAELITPIVTVGSLGTVAGDGLIVGDVDNGGKVAPGNSTGTLSILGDFNQQSGGRLEIELNDRTVGEFDVLEVTGDGTLQGTLDLIVSQAFSAPVGSVITILLGSSITGEFDTTLGAELEGGRSLSISYSPNVTLTVVQSPPDCNLNGVGDDLDIDGGGSNDCDANSIPDECQIDPVGGAPGGPFFCETYCDADCNLNGVPDECDIAEDGSEDCTANGVPDECEPDCNGNQIADSCDIFACSLGDPLCKDCNNNSVLDGCDLDAGTSQDLDGDGIPDECSFWDTGKGSWANPANWEPPVVPDNEGQTSFNVVISGETASVILDIDAVIDTLVLAEGASVSITEGDLSLAAPGGILNDGQFLIGPDHAVIALVPISLQGSSPFELVGSNAMLSSAIDTAVITNLGLIRGRGIIDAAFENLGMVSADVPGEELIVTGPNLKINDGVFQGVDGGEFVITDTEITGNGDYLVDGGTLRISPGAEDVALQGATLTAINDGIVEVGGDALIDLSGLVTIESGGIYRAYREGTETISAKLTSDELSIGGGSDAIPRGGLLTLEDLMVVDIDGGIFINGYCGSSARGCTPPVTKCVDSSMLSAATLEVINSGEILVGGQAILSIGASMTLSNGGYYGPDPERIEGSHASLISGGLLIENGSRVELNDGMSMTAFGDFFLQEGCSVTGARGCTPPVLHVTVDAGLVIAGHWFLGGAVEVLLNSSLPTRINGNFDNQAVAANIFDMAGGKIIMDGTSQSLEAAGRDIGPFSAGLSDNFALGTLEAAPGTTVNILDGFDNQQDGQEVCEALYVDTLIVRSGATFNTSGCPVYYNNLVPQGTIPGLGTDVLPVIACQGDANNDGVIDPLDGGYILSRVNCAVGVGDSSCDAADVNEDLVVDPLDVGYALSRFQVCFAPPEECIADTNGDGYVDPLDEGFVTARNGCAVGKGDEDCDSADVNGDGFVDPLDVGFLRARFGPCDGAKVPVPCEGDVNDDDVVDPLDVGFVSSRFGCAIGTGDSQCDIADQNGDGTVDPLDVGYVVARLGACE